MCGIAGIISGKPRRFDYASFCVLGMANDSRGGDSCGIFIDGKWEHCVGDEKLFSNHFVSSALLKDTRQSTVALVHCRKASVGKVCAETAQPVVVEKNGLVRFVLMHNGTIRNHMELGRKYLHDMEDRLQDMTDSQVMAHAIYRHGFGVLSEYEGSGAFVMVDYRPRKPRTFLFRGVSREYSTSKDAVEERPLFLVHDSRRQLLMFSSIGRILEALNRGAELLVPKENTVVEFTGATLSVVEEIDRSARTQKETRALSNVAGSQWWNGYGTSDQWPYASSYGGYANANDIAEMADDGYHYINADEKTGMYYDTLGKPMHGHYVVDKYGSYTRSRHSQGRMMAFYKGILMRDRHAYRDVSRLQHALHETADGMMLRYPTLVRYYGWNRMYLIGGGVTYVVKRPFVFEPFTGRVSLPLWSSEHVYRNGIEIAAQRTGIKGTPELSSWTEESDKPLGYKEVCEFMKLRETGRSTKASVTG